MDIFQTGGSRIDFASALSALVPDKIDTYGPPVVERGRPFFRRAVPGLILRTSKRDVSKDGHLDVFSIVTDH